MTVWESRKKKETRRRLVREARTSTKSPSHVTNVHFDFGTIFIRADASILVYTRCYRWCWRGQCLTGQCLTCSRALLLNECTTPGLCPPVSNNHVRGSIFRVSFEFGSAVCSLVRDGLDTLEDNRIPGLVHFIARAGRRYSRRRCWKVEWEIFETQVELLSFEGSNTSCTPVPMIHDLFELAVNLGWIFLTFLGSKFTENESFLLGVLGTEWNVTEYDFRELENF